MKRKTNNLRLRNITSTALICIVCLIFLSFLTPRYSNRNYEQVSINNPPKSSQISSSNPPEQQWNITWGGIEDEAGFGIALDSSENIYIAGTTSSFGTGGEDVALIKYNNLGELQWNITWGGINNDSASEIALDSSDNLYVGGGTISYGAGGRDIALIKFNSLGQVQWFTTWGGSGYDHGNAIALYNSENIYIAGGTQSFGAGSSDMVLLKYNNLGQQQWNTTWGGIDIDTEFSIVVDSSENIYVTGFTDGEDGDLVLVKYNNLGQQQWNTTWGGIEFESGFGIALDSSENIYICGMTRSFGAGEFDIVILKYNSLGQQQWNTTWGGSEPEAGWSIALDSSDNLYVGGGTQSYGAGGMDMVLVKYDSLGQPQWNTTWGGVSDEDGKTVVLDSPDNIYLVGTTSSFGAGGMDMVLVKYSESSGDNGAGRIPGYDLFLLLGAICVISTMIIKKHHNQQYLKNTF